MGIIISVELTCRAAYHIEEHVRGYDEVEAVLAAEAAFPLQQFYYLPWKWKYLAQHRRESPQPRSWLAPLYRLYWFLTIDVALHLVIKLLVQILRSRRLVQFFYRRVLTLFVIRNWYVVDHSDKMLVMEHELFRHIEIELFVRRSALPDALHYLREILECFDGNPERVSPATRARLAAIGMTTELFESAGTYTHHYAICIRRVVPDATLVSMSSGGEEDFYAISLISYARPNRREGFMRFANFIARSMAKLFGARPHWGKVCPLANSELEPLYADMAQFRRVCEQYDPAGSFRNAWVNRTIWPTASRSGAGH